MNPVFLTDYKNQFIAQGINDTKANKSLLENAKSRINGVLSQMEINKSVLENENTKLQNKIKETNAFIKQAKERNDLLKGEADRLSNSDLGAIEQNKNFIRVLMAKRTELILKVCLIALIFIFLYIKDDVVQAIRSRLPTKVKSV